MSSSCKHIPQLAVDRSFLVGLHLGRGIKIDHADAILRMLSWRVERCTNTGLKHHPMKRYWQLPSTASEPLHIHLFHKSAWASQPGMQRGPYEEENFGHLLCGILVGGSACFTIATSALIRAFADCASQRPQSPPHLTTVSAKGPDRVVHLRTDGWTSRPKPSPLRRRDLNEMSQDIDAAKNACQLLIGSIGHHELPFQTLHGLSRSHNELD
ncbi:hypothetical protein TgHK011_002004 [Trichoderma gracile]|nr:hypothetical protein TgHK011_002004 [Trichoderma gracile]